MKAGVRQRMERSCFKAFQLFPLPAFLALLLPVLPRLPVLAANVVLKFKRKILRKEDVTNL